MEDIFARAERLADGIRARIGSRKPSVGLVLGSGWGGAAGSLSDPVKIPYASLEGMPQCGVAGHAGEMTVGKAGDVCAVIFCGRFHLYEGRPCSEVVLPVAIMHALGIKKVLLTNSAGAINASFSVGDMMVLSDHINLTGVNPLRGIRARDKYPVFVDMSAVYDAALSTVLEKSLVAADLPVKRGVYLQVMGPTYESRAEVRAYRALGADAVGMSTAVEAMYANYLRMRTAAVSCITNQAAGMGGKVCHEEVLEQTALREKKLSEAVLSFIENSASA